MGGEGETFQRARRPPAVAPTSREGGRLNARGAFLRSRRRRRRGLGRGFGKGLGVDRRRGEFSVAGVSEEAQKAGTSRFARRSGVPLREAFREIDLFFVGGEFRGGDGFVEGAVGRERGEVEDALSFRVDRRG